MQGITLKNHPTEDTVDVHGCHVLWSQVYRAPLSKSNRTALFVPVICRCSERITINVHDLHTRRSFMCANCAREKRDQGYTPDKHLKWIGGRTISHSGYAIIHKSNLTPEDIAALGDGINIPGNYIYEHRLVMARHLGRPLTPKDIVHHINGDKTDNRIENLELTTRRSHAYDHKTLQLELVRCENHIVELQRKIALLQRYILAHNLTLPVLDDVVQN